MTRQATATRQQSPRWEDLAQRARVAALQWAAQRMSMRLASSQHSAGLFALDDETRANRHVRAADRQQAALWRLIDALAAEATR